jgi:hypothetical protein
VGTARAADVVLRRLSAAERFARSHDEYLIAMVSRFECRLPGLEIEILARWGAAERRS